MFFLSHWQIWASIDGIRVAWEVRNTYCKATRKNTCYNPISVFTSGASHKSDPSVTHSEPTMLISDLRTAGLWGFFVRKNVLKRLKLNLLNPSTGVQFLDMCQHIWATNNLLILKLSFKNPVTTAAYCCTQSSRLAPAYLPVGSFHFYSSCAAFRRTCHTLKCAGSCCFFFFSFLNLKSTDSTETTIRIS